jgi:hypothetical protein
VIAWIFRLIFPINLRKSGKLESNINRLVAFPVRRKLKIFVCNDQSSLSISDCSTCIELSDADENLECLGIRFGSFEKRIPAVVRGGTTRKSEKFVFGTRLKTVFFSIIKWVSAVKLISWILL